MGIDDSIKRNIGTIGAGVGGAALGAALGYYAGARRRKGKNRRKQRIKRRTVRKKNRKSKRKQKKPYTAGKRKDTSHRRIRFTKNNQPYIILANGRAKFISKRSMSSSRKRQGGKY